MRVFIVDGVALGGTPP